MRLGYTVTMNATFPLEQLITILPVGPILWVVAVIAAVLFLIHAAIMMWHWREYSTGVYTTAANLLVFLGVGGGFITLMFISALWYSLA
jgi:hypothetical protein